MPQATVTYLEYVELCRVMGQQPWSMTEEYGQHYVTLRAQHREKYGSKEPDLTQGSYADYTALCLVMGAIAQGYSTNWRAHLKHLAYLQQNGRPMNSQDMMIETTVYPAVAIQQEPLDWDKKAATEGTSYAEYALLCEQADSTPYPYGGVHWFLHCGELKKRLVQSEGGTNAALPTDPAQVAVQIPIALQAAPQAVTTPILTWPLYTRLAVRTEARPFIAWPSEVSLKVPNPEWISRLLHVGIGLSCESIELTDKVDLRNQAEELGDCYWYLAVASDIPGLNWAYDFDGAWDHIHGMEEGIYEGVCLEKMGHYAGLILDMVGQKQAIYGKPVDPGKLRGYLTLYTFQLLALTQSYRVNWKTICQANLDKLAKRYPDLSWSLEATSNRDVENELSHIPEDGVAGLEKALLADLAGDVGAAVEEAKEAPKS